MFGLLMSKISAYLKIGLLVIIILGLVFIGYQWIRINSLENKLDDVRKENDVLTKEISFEKIKNDIADNFTNSTIIISKITNEMTFESNKQIAIDSIVEGFYTKGVQTYEELIK